MEQENIRNVFGTAIIHNNESKHQKKKNRNGNRNRNRNGHGKNKISNNINIENEPATKISNNINIEYEPATKISNDIILNYYNNIKNSLYICDELHIVHIEYLKSINNFLISFGQNMGNKIYSLINIMNNYIQVNSTIGYHFNEIVKNENPSNDGNNKTISSSNRICSDMVQLKGCTHDIIAEICEFLFTYTGNIKIPSHIFTYMVHENISHHYDLQLVELKDNIIRMKKIYEYMLNYTADIENIDLNISWIVSKMSIEGVTNDLEKIYTIIGAL